MTTIPLPLSRQMKMFGSGILLGTVSLSLWCQTAWPWKPAAAVVLLLTGILLWRHYLCHRPVNLTVTTDGRLWCTLADGQILEAVRILPGIIRPGLVSARLEGRSGNHCHLFVPGDSLTAAAHWQLRRALVGFRPAQAEDGRGT